MISFKNMKLTHKFSLLFGVLFVSFIVIGYMYSEIQRVSDYSNNKRSEINKANQLINQVDISVLQARRSEKDFILRTDIKYASKNKDAIINSLTALDNLESLEISDENIQQDISQLRNNINVYHSLFKEMVELQTVLGLDEKKGLLGNLRKAVHEVEAMLAEANQVELSASMLMMRRHEKDFLARKADKYVEKMVNEQQVFADKLATSALPLDQKEQISRLMAQYHKDFLAMVDGSKKTEARIKAFREAVHKVEPALDGLRTDLSEASSNLIQEVELQEKRIDAIFISTLVGICAIVFVSFLVLSRNVKRATSKAVDVTQLLESGDLTTSIMIESHDEFGQQLSTLKSMQDRLKVVITGIKDGASQVSSAAEQVAQGNTDLSQRTQEQASSLEEIASSMEEMTSTVNQNADNAKQADQLARAARDKAEKGGEVANQAVNAMNEINESSKKIVDIVALIDEIAFQTNLLALNAAVEAARAGEQGRGFAVVANEVRNLAARCATAAKEIKSLIENSVSQIQGGTRLVGESGKTLEDIVISIKKVSDIVAEIAMASEEQSQGIAQVNQAVMQMDEMTQQNASLVEEAAAASEAMGAQAEELRNSVEFFKVNGTSDIHVERIDHVSSEAINFTRHDELQDHTPSNSNGRKNGNGKHNGNGKAHDVPAHWNARTLPQVMSENVSDDTHWQEF